MAMSPSEAGQGIMSEEYELRRKKRCPRNLAVETGRANNVEGENRLCLYILGGELNSPFFTGSSAFG